MICVNSYISHNAFHLNQQQQHIQVHVQIWTVEVHKSVTTYQHLRNCCFVFFSYFQPAVCYDGCGQSVIEKNIKTWIPPLFVWLQLDEQLEARVNQINLFHFSAS